MQFSSKRTLGRLVVLVVALGGLMAVAGCGTSPTPDTLTASPAFKPGGGTYSSSQTVTITDSTAGAVLYCTTDGTTPTTSSPQCSQPTTVFKSEYLQAMAVAPGMAASAVASAGYTINLAATATPTFSIGGGTYTSAQTVAISDATTGANIFYTTDGTTPTSSSTLYSGPIAVSTNETISAIAVASGYNNSGVAVASYAINLVIAPPTLSPVGGTYTTAQTVTISDATAGVQIYYTTNGSAPSASNGTLYTTAIPVGATATIQAVAVLSGHANSAIASATYTLNTTPLATPTFSPAPGSYNAAQTVTLSDTAAGVSLFYTIDGSTPSASSTPYNGPINVAATEVVKSIAILSGYPNSAVASGTYVVTTPLTATLTFSPAAGTYHAVQTVTISNSASGASIYYTTDGTTPTASSTLYNGPITVSGNETIQAVAVESGFTNSAVATAAYVISLNPAPTPTFSPAPGTYLSAQSVTIGDSQSGAVIYYTTDGSAPTTTSPTYSSAISVTAGATIKAIALAPGFDSSSVAVGTYNVFTNSATLTGTVMTGTNPVSGATIQLYAAGQTGYGSKGTALIPVSTSATTTSNGGFAFTYGCPAAPGDQMYLVATGGDSGAGPNAGLALMTALGSCHNSNLPASIVVNEATTVASVYSLAQFESLPATGNGIVIGTSATNAIGLANAMKTVPNLVDLPTGTVLAITPFYQRLGSASGGLLDSSYVPQARIDTLANMLNGCAHSNGVGSGCSSLFSAATIPSSTAPLDTLQAMLNIAQHPGTNAAGVYAVASPSGPFQPALTSSPSDWTLALTFQGGGLGTVPNDTSGNGGAAVLGLAIDATGNIWLPVQNLCANATFNSFADGVVKFDNQGNAVSPGLAYDVSNNCTGGFQPTFNGTPVLSSGFASAVTVDLEGSIWLPAPSALVKMSQDGTVHQGAYGAPLCSSFNTLEVDGADGVWYSCSGGIGANLATDGSFIADQYKDGTTVIDSIGGMTLDPVGHLWAVTTPHGSSDSNISEFGILGVSSTNPTNPPVVTNDIANTGPGMFSSTDLLADGAMNIFAPNPTPGTISVLDSTSSLTALTYPLPTGAYGVTRLALDGAGNLWGAAFSGQVGVFTGTTVPSYLVEMTSPNPITSSPGGTILSPSDSSANVYGYTGTGGGGETQPILANVGVSNAFQGIAVDGSGNVWVANSNVADPSFAGVPAGQQLVEFIGLAAPVATPTALALKNNTLGVRP